MVFGHMHRDDLMMILVWGTSHGDNGDKNFNFLSISGLIALFSLRTPCHIALIHHTGPFSSSERMGRETSSPSSSILPVTTFPSSVELLQASGGWSQEKYAVELCPGLLLLRVSSHHLQNLKADAPGPTYHHHHQMSSIIIMPSLMHLDHSYTGNITSVLPFKLTLMMMTSTLFLPSFFS